MQDKLKDMPHSSVASAGTILLSLGFFPTEGTPKLLPVPVHAPPSMSTRNSRQPPLPSVSPSSVGGGNTGRDNQGFPKPNTPVLLETPSLSGTVIAEGEELLAQPEMKISTIPSPLGSPGWPDVQVERSDGVLGSNREGTQSEVGEDGDRSGLSENIGGVHLFRIKSYSSPVWCHVCGRLLLGVSVMTYGGKACLFIGHIYTSKIADPLYFCDFHDI